MNSEDLKSTFIEQSRIALHISNRDLGKRLASIGLMLWVCTLGGAFYAGVTATFAVLINEVAARLLVRNMPDGSRPVSLRFALLIWVNNISAILPYLYFSIILAGQPSVPLMLCGFMWLFAIYVHTANTFVLLPFYNWALMIPSFGAGFWVFYAASATEFSPSSATNWIVATSLFGVYILNTYETMNQHKDTKAALAQAQSDADKRLRQLEHLSHHDNLTGLFNRTRFDQFLGEDLSDPPQHLYLFIIDLDDFKPINDSYSHQAGDTVLQELACRLAALTGNNGRLARMGGDEFALYRRDLDNDAKANALAVRIAHEVRQPIEFEGKVLRVGASIGIAKMKDGDSVEAICSRADQAMYMAKGNADRQVFQYDPAVIPKRATLDDKDALHRALLNGQIRPYYQPKVCVQSGNVVGFEALARWEHPQDGLLFPGGFLPEIEAFGLSVDLLLHMTRTVLADMTELQKQGFELGQVSVNVPEEALATVSGRTDLMSVLRDFPEARGNLTFEITEDVFIARSGGVIASTISYFRSEGVRISLDDFGTGFASFQHLRELEFDELKLDTGFVRGLGIERSAEVLVESFLSIGNGLGVQVVAEGVETELQRDILAEMGCEIAQGFLYAKAMPIEDVRSFLTRREAQSSVA